MSELFEKYDRCPESDVILADLQKIKVIASERARDVDFMKRVFSFVDLTTLNAADTVGVVSALCEKANTFKSKYESLGLPAFAAVCVYPSFVEMVSKALKNKKIHVASVSGGFPSSQTFMDVKLLETRMAVAAGADEIDMVVSVGKVLDGLWDEVGQEIQDMKAACGDAHLKVILETGALESYENIYRASLVALESGADFIKTSTGKLSPAATPEAFYVMACAVREFYKQYELERGLKAAGGISTGADAALYCSVVLYVLGNDWLKPKLFRIGASSLVNNLVAEIQKL